MQVACIGSRVLGPGQLAKCGKLGVWLVQCGHSLHSGNAPGADQAFARGGNAVEPEKVHLHLPWHSFHWEARHPRNVIHLLDELPQHRLQMYLEIAQQYHPAFARLSQGAQKLMTRNSSILLPPPEYQPVDLCLAWPDWSKKGGGGTGQGLRIAEAKGIRCVDLTKQTDDDLYALCEWLQKEGGG